MWTLLAMNNAWEHDGNIRKKTLSHVTTSPKLRPIHVLLPEAKQREAIMSQRSSPEGYSGVTEGNMFHHCWLSHALIALMLDHLHCLLMHSCNFVFRYFCPHSIHFLHIHLPNMCLSKHWPTFIWAWLRHNFALMVVSLFISASHHSHQPVSSAWLS